jgi:hypothetical protein
MTKFVRQSFVGMFDRDSGGVLADLEFEACYFEGCGLSITRSPSLRTVVRQTKLLDCEQRGSQVDGCVFDEVLVEDLKTNGLLQTWAAVFRHVSLRGKIGRVMFSDVVAAGIASREEQREFDRANEEFYAAVDWAIDISEAQFEECDLRGVPARLVRRDPSTQAVVTREAAMAGGWRNVDLSKTYWATAIELFLQSQRADVVLVAPRRHRKFKDLLEGLHRLRECGAAE